MNSPLRLAALLLVATLAIYYPVLSADFVNLDDIDMLLAHDTRDEPLQLGKLFFPPTTARYYRPLHILSFHLDHSIWQQEPSGYHLTNYILHAINSLLLFAILLSLLPRLHLEQNLALPGALLFALHPLTCESVAWISGRTDIIASLFCLAAFRFYLATHWLRYPAVFAGLLLGLLAKESAAALIPIVLLTDWAMGVQAGKNLRQNTKSCATWILNFLPALLIYAWMRMGGVSGIDHGLQGAISNKVAAEGGTIAQGIGSYLLHFCAAVAFYIKKLFIPLPLNVAIYQISVWPYFFLFLGLVAVVAYFLVKKKYPIPFWLALMAASFSPALLVATSKMAWTPFAERYLYLSCAVWAVAIVLAVASLSRVLLPRGALLRPLLWALIGLWGAATLQRTFVWHNDLSIWEATMAHAPNFGKALYKYGTALASSGKKEEGLRVFQRAVEVARNEDWKWYSLISLGDNARAEKRPNEALAYYRQALAIKADHYSHSALGNFYITALAKSPTEKEELIEKAFFHYREAYNQKHDPFYLYTIANKQLEIAPGAAQSTFLEILDNHPRSKYANYSHIILKRLKNKEQSDQ